MLKFISTFLLVFMFIVAYSHYPKMLKENAYKEEKETVVGDSTKRPDVSNVVTDTASYAKGIMDNKVKYIGKPFSVLLNDLKIPPKSYFIIDSRENINIVPYIEIHFDDLKTTIRKVENIDGLDNPVQLQITWMTPVSYADAMEVRHKSTSPGDWHQAEQDFYSKQVVKDINYYYNKR